MTQVRPMTPADTAAALAVFEAVGWGNRRTQTDFFTSRPDSVLFVAETGGRVIGCGGATVYGPAERPRTGWIHSIVVDPASQRSGAGRRLTEATMRWLEERRVPTMLLLATPAGRPVYERLGFHLERRYQVLRWPGMDGAVTGPGLRRVRTDDVPALLALGRDATGEDRSALLPHAVVLGDRQRERRGAADVSVVDRMWFGIPPPAWRPEMVFGVFNRALA